MVISHCFLRIYSLPLAAGETHSVPSVEWFYAFDIHCNSFFPLSLLLYILQYLLIFVLFNHGYIALFLSNTLYIVALGYYYYITFLGFTGIFLNTSPVICFLSCYEYHGLISFSFKVLAKHTMDFDTISCLYYPVYFIRLCATSLWDLLQRHGLCNQFLFRDCSKVLIN